MRIDGHSPVISTPVSSATNELRVGDSMRGEVIFNKGNEAHIRLDNGAVLKAKTEGSVNLNLGDQIILQVSDKSASQITLKVVNNASTDNLLRATDNMLKSLDLPVTKENAEVINFLQSKNIPITKELINNINQLWQGGNGKIDLPQAVFIAANKIDITNPAELQAWQNLVAGGKENLLGNQIEQLGNLLQQLILALGDGLGNIGGTGNISAGGQGAALNNINMLFFPQITETNLLNFLNQVQPEIAQTIVQNGQGQALIQILQTAANLPPSEISNYLQNAIKELLPNLNSQSSQNLLNNLVSFINNNNQGAINQPNANINWQTGFNQALNNLMQNNNQLGQFINNNQMQGAMEQVVANSIGQGSQQIAANINNFIAQLPPGLTQENIAQLSQFLNSAVNQINSQIASMAQPGSGLNANLALNKIQQQFNSLFVNFGAGGENMKAETGGLGAKIASMWQIMQQMPATGREAIMGQMEQIMQQVKLNNDLSQFSYVQMPVRLGDENKTAELYVMKRDKGKNAIDKENVTMLLGLDTEYMGRLETLIQVQQKDVSLQFRMNNDRAISFLQNHTVKLYNVLDEIGYRLGDVRYQNIETPVDVLNIEEIIQTEYFGRGKVNIQI